MSVAHPGRDPDLLPPRTLFNRLFPSLPISGAIFVVWLLLMNSVSPGNLLLALFLAVTLPWFTQRIRPKHAHIRFSRQFFAIIPILLWDIFVANFQMARQILGPEKNIRPGFVWVPLDIKSAHGLAALVGLTTMTPGKLSAELSEDHRYLLVHCFHLDDPQGVIDEIKERYEKRLLRIFP